MGFGLVIGFIRSSLVIATLNYYTIAGLRYAQSLHMNLFTLSTVDFTYL
jgi:hypothetical protein